MLQASSFLQQALTQLGLMQIEKKMLKIDKERLFRLNLNSNLDHTEKYLSTPKL